MKSPLSLSVCACLLGTVLHADPGSNGEQDIDYAELSLEELLNVEVVATSVAKKPTPVHESAAAIYVVTAEDIRRSGFWDTINL